MRLFAAILLFSTICACAESPAPPAAVATPAPPAVSEIPETPGRSASGDSDMRSLEPFVGDLDSLISRGTLRILAVPGRTHFETTGSVQRGRTVDAAVAFERFVNERIAPRSVSVVLLPATESSLVADLVAGQGDIAANVLLTFERDEKIAFASPVRSGIGELVVTSAKGAPLVSLEDVGGRTIHVQGDSDHHASLLRLNAQLTSINRPAARIVTSTAGVEDLLAQVNAGTVPATLAYDYVFDFWSKTLPGVSVNRDVSVSQGGVIAWTTRRDAPKLLEMINEFFTKHRLTF